MSQPGDDDPHWDDPSAARVTGPEMWGIHTILHRLRRIHFATGQLVVALILARIAGSENLTVVALVALGAMGVLVIATSYRATNRLVLISTAWSTAFAEAIALWAVAAFVFGVATLDLTAVHRTTFHIAIALGVAAGVAIIGGVPTVGALTFATFIGGALGVGAGLITEDLLSVGDNLITQGAAWVAPASLIFLLLVALSAIGLTFTGSPQIQKEGLSNRLLTRITRRSRVLLWAAAIFGLILGSLAIFEGCVSQPGICQPDVLTEFSGANAAVVALLVAIPWLLALRLFPFSRVAAIGLGLAGAIVLWIGIASPSFGSFQPGNYLKALPLSRTLIFIAPVVAIGRSVLGAYRQGASSRKVGILWDVASFWPRWFHPLAPPAYGPKVVRDLKKQVSSGGVNVLAGHSQGSVIAAIATYQATAAGGTLPSGLVTYGSPIGLLYRPLFPDVGLDDLIDALPASLETGWSNLWRVDDPIGGEPLGGSVDAVPEEDGSGHSGYELTRIFRKTRDRLVP